ncbi:hypothetical protein LJC35_06670 [Parabacteroides sp. OttesenSCG-928-N08]|nr:hypothetical protein [Parabacteroides sp. OttesenSCG-928-N08]
MKKVINSSSKPRLPTAVYRRSTAFLLIALSATTSILLCNQDYYPLASDRAIVEVKSFHPGGTTVPPRWDSCLTRVEQVSHPGGTT